MRATWPLNALVVTGGSIRKKASFIENVAAVHSKGVLGVDLSLTLGAGNKNVLDLWSLTELGRIGFGLPSFKSGDDSRDFHTFPGLFKASGSLLHGLPCLPVLAELEQLGKSEGELLSISCGLLQFFHVSRRQPFERSCKWSEGFQQVDHRGGCGLGILACFLQFVCEAGYLLLPRDLLEGVFQSPI